MLDEGIDLRNAGITMPIMVLNPKVLNYRLLFSNRLEPEIYGFDILNEIIAEARKLGVHDYPVHIKLDTGMHRLGFLEDDLPEVIDIIRRQDNIRVSSVFSHLATADCPDMDDYTTMQLETFERCSKQITDAFPYRVKRHILNTAGIIRFPRYQYDMVRLGIGLYGVPVLNDGSEAPPSAGFHIAFSDYINQALGCRHNNRLWPTRCAYPPKPCSNSADRLCRRHKPAHGMRPCKFHRERGQMPYCRKHLHGYMHD